MRIDKLDEVVYALDKIIERYINREYNPTTINSLRNEMYNFFRGILYPYCGLTMSKTIIRNELIANLGEAQAAEVCNHLF